VPSRRHSSRKQRSLPSIELTIFIVGLIAAIASGVIAYRIVGPYGDGFLNMYLYRVQDPETGKFVLARKGRTADGQVRWVHYDEQSRRLQAVRVPLGDGFFGIVYENGKITGLDNDTDGDGRADIKNYYDDESKLVKVGFSSAGNGIIDAWEYRDAAGEIERIEVSRRQDGVVDRTEFYQAGQLARVEEDDDRNGRVDRWLTYEAGILMEEAEDRNGDGTPDQAPGTNN
jgi:antitoxin component YwqK of YwqJK toxin-antitoxin module